MALRQDGLNTKTGSNHSVHAHSLTHDHCQCAMTKYKYDRTGLNIVEAV